MRFTTLIKPAENAKMEPQKGWEGETEVREVMQAPASSAGAAHD